MYVQRLSNLVKRLELKQAKDIFIKKGVCLFRDNQNRLCAYKNYYTDKQHGISKEDRKEVEDLERLCNTLFIKFCANVFIDDLQDDFLTKCNEM